MGAAKSQANNETATKVRVLDRISAASRRAVALATTCESTSSKGSFVEDAVDALPQLGAGSLPLAGLDAADGPDVAPNEGGKLDLRESGFEPSNPEPSSSIRVHGLLGDGEARPTIGRAALSPCVPAGVGPGGLAAVARTRPRTLRQVLYVVKSAHVFLVAALLNL